MLARNIYSECIDSRLLQAVCTTTTIPLLSTVGSQLLDLVFPSHADPIGVLGLDWLPVLLEVGGAVVKTLTSLIPMPKVPSASFEHISFFISSLNVLEEGDSTDSIVEVYRKGANADEEGVGG